VSEVGQTTSARAAANSSVNDPQRPRSSVRLPPRLALICASVNSTCFAATQTLVVISSQALSA